MTTRVTQESRNIGHSKRPQAPSKKPIIVEGLKGRVEINFKSRTSAKIEEFRQDADCMKALSALQDPNKERSIFQKEANEFAKLDRVKRQARLDFLSDKSLPDLCRNSSRGVLAILISWVSAVREVLFGYISSEDHISSEDQDIVAKMHYKDLAKINWLKFLEEIDQDIPSLEDLGAPSLDLGLVEDEQPEPEYRMPAFEPVWQPFMPVEPIRITVVPSAPSKQEPVLASAQAEELPPTYANALLARTIAQEPTPEFAPPLYDNLPPPAYTEQPVTEVQPLAQEPAPDVLPPSYAEATAS